MKARVIALYLPQYHPIPENDEWWGKGFTEWYNVAKATPVFRGHYQPKIPTELGFYDLRLPEVREQQAELAREAGVEAFCYWHYWFGNGRRLLEKPFNEVLESGKPDFPFCLGWANHTWTSKTWNKEKNRNTPSILLEQKYLGDEDYKQHFYAVLPAFKDKRYVTVDGKPFFLIFDPLNFEDVTHFMNYWRQLAKENGLPGIHFVGVGYSASFRSVDGKKYNRFKMTSPEDNFNHILSLGFDAVNSMGLTRANVMAKGIFKSFVTEFLKRKLSINIVDRVKQSEINKYLFTKEDKWENVYPSVIPNYDRTPRTNKDVFYIDSTPEVFKESLENCINLVKDKNPEHRIILLKSWNEWGEGNYVEPDIKYGKGYIYALRDALKD